MDSALRDELQSCNDVRSVFVSILQASDLDNRDKKAAIIDYIAAGIKTVSKKHHYRLPPPPMYNALFFFSFSSWETR